MGNEHALAITESQETRLTTAQRWLQEFTTAIETEFLERRDALLTEWDGSPIEDNDDLVTAGELAKRLKLLSEEVGLRIEGTDQTPGVSKLLFNAHRVVTGQRAAIVKPVDDLYKTVHKAISAYNFEQERKRQEAEMKARHEAEEAANKEADRIAKLRQSEALRQATAEGDKKAVRELSSKAALEDFRPEVLITPVSLPSTVPKIEGHRNRMVRKWAIVDPTKIAIKFLLPREKDVWNVNAPVYWHIRERVAEGAMKEETEREIGGIKIWEEPA